MHKMPPTHIAIAVLGSFFLSLNVIVIKSGMNHFPPFLFATLRFLSIAPFAFFLPRPTVSFIALIKISMCWGVIYLGGLTLALSLGVSAGIATIITQISTFIGFFLSWKVFNDRPNFDRILGAFVGFLGVCLICTSTLAQNHTLGMLSLLVCAFSFALGAVFVKQAQAPPLALNIWINAVSVFPMFCISFVTNEPIVTPIVTASIQDWGGVLFTGWCSTFLGGMCLLFILSKYSLTVAMPFRLLIPLFGVVLAYFLLGEMHSFITWMGSFIVVLGLSLPYFIDLMRQPLPLKNSKKKISSLIH